jgi:hypothetical protein
MTLEHALPAAGAGRGQPACGPGIKVPGRPMRTNLTGPCAHQCLCGRWCRTMKCRSLQGAAYIGQSPKVAKGGTMSGVELEIPDPT